MSQTTKRNTTARPGRKSPHRSTRGRAGLRWKLVATFVSVAAVIGVIVWANQNSGGTGNPAGASARIEHIHGLGINPADGALYAAAHNGVFQLLGATATRVGEREQDTMGFTIAGPNTFLASGHPAPGQGGPKHLGLIESVDAGQTWKTWSLAGNADFHALRYRHNTVYGHNSATGQLLVSRDKTNWETRTSMPIGDLAVSPSSPDILLAVTQTGVQKSGDGGRTWAPAGGPPLSLLDWPTDGVLWGVTATGDVMRSTDNGATWNRTGGLGGQATAFTTNDDDLYAAVHNKGILHSTDQGATWQTVYS